MAAPPTWTGTYINLDRARDRRASIERELARTGLIAGYTRFPALAGKPQPGKTVLTPGELGCFLSHAGAIAAGEPGRWRHVLEDDAVLPDSFGDIVGQFIASGALEPFDMIFTNITIAAPHIITIRSLKAAYDSAVANAPNLHLGIRDLRDSNFGSTDSYLVNPASAGKVQAALQAELDTGPTVGIDMLYRREVQQGRLRAGVIFPFVSRIQLALGTQSDIGPRDAQSMASDLLRLVFYFEHDPAEIAAALRQLKAPPAGNRHLDLLLAILGVMITA